MPSVTTFTAAALVTDGALNGAYSIFDPLVDIIYYIFPQIGTYFSGGGNVNRESVDETEAPELIEARVKVLDQKDNLVKVVGLKRDVELWTSKKRQFSSFGGRFSFTDPVVQVSDEYLFRPKMKTRDGRTIEPGNFGSEPDRRLLETHPGRNPEADENERLEYNRLSEADEYRQLLEADPDHYSNHYTDQETRFLILRSLHQVKMNDSMFKLITRVAMVTAIVLLKIGVLFWPITLGILVGAVIVYFIVDRYTQGKLDEAALKSLIEYSATHDKPKKEAIDGAIGVIQKIKTQNLKLREKGGRFSKLWINADGDERFNLAAPSLARRIEKLEKLREKLLAAPKEDRAPPGIWSDLHREEAFMMGQGAY